MSQALLAHCEPSRREQDTRPKAETRRPRDYDLAASLLPDLQALADRQEDSWRRYAREYGSSARAGYTGMPIQPCRFGALVAPEVYGLAAGSFMASDKGQGNRQGLVDAAH